MSEYGAFGLVHSIIAKKQNPKIDDSDQEFMVFTLLLKVGMQIALSLSTTDAHLACATKYHRSKISMANKVLQLIQ